MASNLSRKINKNGKALLRGTSLAPHRQGLPIVGGKLNLNGQTLPLCYLLKEDDIMLVIELHTSNTRLSFS